MSVFKPKTRMISFRISEEEYERLRKISMAKARSLSDCARSALCRLTSSELESSGDEFEAMIKELDAKMQELNRELQRLHQVAQHRKEPAATEAPVPSPA
jgi:hypothetical protein